MTQRFSVSSRLRKKLSSMLTAFLCCSFVLFLVMGDLARAEPIAFQLISHKKAVEGESKIQVPSQAQATAQATAQTSAKATVNYTGSLVELSKTTSTVNGKPFTLKGLYGVSILAMPRIKSYGFNVVQDYGASKLSPDRIQRIVAYLNAAQANGLMVHLTLGAIYLSAEELKSIKELVIAVKDHPALYDWYLADEPAVERLNPSTFHELYLWVKATDQNRHPVINSNWELKKFKDSTDVDMRQLYTGAAANMYSNSPGYFSYVESNNVNFLAILNTHDSTFAVPESDRLLGLTPGIFMKGLVKGTAEYDAMVLRAKNIEANLENPPYPANKAFPDTPERVRGQLWEGISRGSNGAFWYIASSETKIDTGNYTIFHRTPLRNAMKVTLAEMDALAPRILNPTVGSTTWQVGTVRYWYRKVGSQATIIAVNESFSPTTSTTSFEGLGTPTARVSTENRTVVFESPGKLTDTFKANEAHVYLVN